MVNKLFFVYNKDKFNESNKKGLSAAVRQKAAVSLKEGKRMPPSVKKLWKTVPVAIFFVVLSVIWLSFYSQSLPVQDSPEIQNGTIDLTGMDLDTVVADLDSSWDFYPNQLYSTQDFEQGVSQAPVQRGNLENRDAIPYGTFRVRLLLPPDRYYSLCGYSIDYGLKAYVNGTLSLKIGTVADNASEAVPRVNYYTLPVFSGVKGEVELIYQYSNFAHRDGGSLTGLMFSNTANMERYKTNQTLPMYLLSGGLLLLAAYYLLDFCVRRKREALAFAFCCLLFGIRDQRFYITQLIPWDYDWPIYYRIMVLGLMWAIFSLYLLLNSLYPRIVNRWLTWVFLMLNAAAVLAVFLLPTTVTATLSVLYYGVSLPFLLWLVVRIIQHLFKTHSFGKKDALTFLGFGALFGALVIEMIFQRNIPFVTRGGVTPLGMLIFVLLIVVVLGLRSGEDAAALIVTRKAAEELEKLYQLRSNFLADISHEMLTPLTVMSGYAQRAKRKIEDGTANQDTLQGVNHISLEAQRLALLVGQILDTRMEQGGQLQLTALSPVSIFERVAALCEPVLSKNNNRLEINVSPGCPEVTADLNVLLQVLLNLCVNANRHTYKDVLYLSASEDSSFVIFTLEDHGDGISPELLPHIFERGVSGDGKSGYGLSICQLIIESMGGVITAQSEQGVCTRFSFSLPIAKEEQTL